MIDTIENKQNSGEDFWSVIDLNRIGIFGHSYGGATSIIALDQDDRIDTAIALDGWILPIRPELIDKGLHKPFLYIGRELWPDQLNNQKLKKLLANSSQQTSLQLQGTAHFDFSDAPLFSPYLQNFGISGSIPANELARMLEAKIVEFFDAHLDHQSAI